MFSPCFQENIRDLKNMICSDVNNAMENHERINLHNLVNIDKLPALPDTV